MDHDWRQITRINTTELGRQYAKKLKVEATQLSDSNPDQWLKLESVTQNMPSDSKMLGKNWSNARKWRLTAYSDRNRVLRTSSYRTLRPLVESNANSNSSTTQWIKYCPVTQIWLSDSKPAQWLKYDSVTQRWPSDSSLGNKGPKVRKWRPAADSDRSRMLETSAYRIYKPLVKIEVEKNHIREVEN